MKLDASDVDSLRPLIDAAVRSTLDQIRANETKLGDKLAYDEATAAGLLGTQRHVLRDQRLNGKIRGVKIGKKIHYDRCELLRYLAEGGGE